MTADFITVGHVSVPGSLLVYDIVLVIRSRSEAATARSALLSALLDKCQQNAESTYGAAALPRFAPLGYLSGAAQRERTTAIALEEVVNADLHQRAAAAPRELVR